jgi:hypothetical protein
MTAALPGAQAGNALRPILNLHGIKKLRRILSCRFRTHDQLQFVLNFGAVEHGRAH